MGRTLYRLDGISKNYTENGKDTVWVFRNDSVNCHVYDSYVLEISRDQYIMFQP